MHWENVGDRNIYYVAAWGMSIKESQFSHNCTLSRSMAVNPEME